MNTHFREPKSALPDAVDAQEQLLGAIFLDNSVYWRVASFLKPEHFGPESDPRRIIYETAGQMIAEARPVNPVTIRPYIPATQAISTDPPLTLFEYVCMIQSEAVGTKAAYENGRAIIEMWARHQIIGVAQDLDRMARNMPVDMTPEKIVSFGADELTRIAQEGNERAGAVRYGVILPNAIDKVAKRRQIAHVQTMSPTTGAALVGNSIDRRVSGSVN